MREVADEENKSICSSAVEDDEIVIRIKAAPEHLRLLQLGMLAYRQDALGLLVDEFDEDLAPTLEACVERTVKTWHDQQLAFDAIVWTLDRFSNCRDWFGCHRPEDFGEHAEGLSDAFSAAKRGDVLEARNRAEDYARAQGFDREPTWQDFDDARKKLGNDASEEAVDAEAQRLYAERAVAP